MRNIIICYCILLFTLACSPKSGPQLIQTKEIPTDTYLIAFGSCSDEDDSQQYWETIAAVQPNLWVWTGDIVYADTDDPKQLRSTFAELKNNRYYSAFERKFPVTGIYDDHDYGINDGGKNFPIKKHSRDILFDFLEVADSSYSRQGAYRAESYTTNNDIKIKLILLDTRYFRDTLKVAESSDEQYKKSKTGDVLGKKQWKWLENELRDTVPDVNLIVSSIQLIPTQQNFEKWGNFPRAREKFLNLLDNSPAHNPILISGDRHIAEVSRYPLKNKGLLYEITSSGLTHTWNRKIAEPNHYRIKSLIIKKNYGLLIISGTPDKPRVKTQIRSVKDNEIYEEVEILLFE